MHTTLPDDLEQIKQLKMLLKRELSRLEQASAMAGDVDSINRNALWLRQISESIATASETIKRGATSATIVNTYTQVPETISLNPKLSPSENAALYLKKAIKAERSIASTNAASDDLLRKHHRLVKAIQRISSVSSSNPQDIADTVAEAKEAINSVVPGFDTPQKNEPKHSRYRRYNIDGWDIFIGKDDLQNDELSTRFAAPSDLWFHVAGQAGSHGVIRRPKGAPMPSHNIIDSTAALIAWFSKARNTPSAEVHWTEARFVHKRRGSPAGEVTVEQWKTIKVTPRSPAQIGVK